MPKWLPLRRPSDKLKCVSVHKLQSLACQRKYFWRHILNVVPRGVSVPLWFGSMVHAGLEAGLSAPIKLRNKPLVAAKIKAAMLAADKRFTDGENIDANMRQEMDIHRAVARILVDGFIAKHGASIVLRETEIALRLDLPCNVRFVGTMDGRGTLDGVDTLFEFKTAGYVSADTFDTLSFDKQVHAYAMASKTPPAQFAYCVLRKPGKHVKQGQSVADFVEEIRADVRDRADWYFPMWKQPVGEIAMRAAHEDIVAAADDLREKYCRLKQYVLDSAQWPRNNEQCHTYGNCPYIQLCKNPETWRQYLRYYKPRETQYPTELTEMIKTKGDK